jgi:hypothetical protein
MTKTLLDYVRETQARYLNASRGEVEHHRGYGLCHNCIHSQDIPSRYIRDDIRVLVESITQKWPAYSGNTAYPVPDPECVYITNEHAADAADRAYYQVSEVGDMYSGEYGSLRKLLAAYIAEGLAGWIMNEEREERGE